MMATIVAITLIMIALFFFFGVNQDLESRLLNQAKTDSKLLAYEFSQSVEDKDVNLANRQAFSLELIPSVKESAIFLANGSLLGFYSRIPGAPIPEVNFQQSEILTDSELILIQPIISQQNTIGYLYVRHDLEKLLAAENKNFIYIGSIFLASLLVAILMAGLFQKVLTYPIRRMVRHINLIYNSNNFEKRLKPIRDDELGRLTLEFNQMLEAVQERENELTMQSKQLQRLVEVRTEQLYQKAHFDSLTGLPNRYLLVDRLHQAISKSSRSKSNLALLFLDLDRFKIINDNLGHQNGDLLLKEVAKRLSNLSRDGDTVARLGGDEFVFLLENLNQPKDAARTANRILESFKTPFQLQDHILHVSTSIGISIYPDNGTDDKILLKNADISMYHAKEKGPGHFSFYSKEMNESSLERLAIESNLRTAVENDEFYLTYQPQMRLKDDSFKNVEALLRWSNPTLGEISPGIFVPISEETGMVNQIDLWVISEVCKQIRLWKEQGLDDITVAINVSAGHLISDTLLEHLKQEIIINKINAKQIEIEITEAVFVEHTERTVKTLEEIKKLGAKIAIDDFGTGYSSLQYIQDFPADTLKLDGMFIRNLANKKSSQGIVRSTIILAHSLGLEIVSECVEDDFQLQFLRDHKCDLVQGYMLSKPLNPQQVLKLCREPVVE
ncbi:EAL domain-containing protein [Aliikangiella marina]|uniref:EAL domain-containing protein n=1 Tax=Aliikangiella marina TaxID=1712262 RepID=A0A545T2I4_9GAMM|nr:EAL domain-containing protein [Aliikangiella marina]TQV71419.1 EAL domain-containing protein [Aliikangiella marina]